MTIGSGNHAFYLNLVKGLFAENLHEVVELHAFGDRNIVRLTGVMRSLVNYKYCEVVRIKTGTEPAPCLKVSLKKGLEFQASFDAHQEVLRKRQEDKEMAKAAEAAKAAAAAVTEPAKEEAADV